MIIEPSLIYKRKTASMDFPAIQRLELCLSTAGGTGSIHGQGTKICNGTRLKKN